ncbi:rhodanese-like domain-containing protein [Parasalinivibrio latis]|uniref:rhodanese-like domain-containing protein n=1 Tax=Parasalinivibrio latis TaxID=2952610 RepID=UPI0030E4B89D
MKRLFLATLFFLLSPLAKAGEVSPKEFWQIAKTPGAVIVDVRTAGEFNGGHLDTALNIPYDKIASLGNVVTEKTTPVLLYCRSGRRADVAERTLRSMGYTNIFNGMSYTLLKTQNPE